MRKGPLLGWLRCCAVVPLVLQRDGSRAGMCALRGVQSAASASAQGGQQITSREKWKGLADVAERLRGGS